MSNTDIILKALASGLKVLAENIETIAEEISEEKEAATEKKSAPVSAPEPAPKVRPAVRKTEKAAPRAKKKTADKKMKTKKASVKNGKDKKSGTDTDYILKIIADSGEGTDLGTLCEKTGFSNSKVRGIVHRLKKKEMITSKQKGFYSKA